MFDRMNVVFPTRAQAAQPSGERQSDDIEGESSAYTSFVKDDVQVVQKEAGSAKKGGSDYTSNASHLFSCKQEESKIEEKSVGSPKNSGPKVLQG